MIILTNEELQKQVLDSFLPMNFMGAVSSKANLQGYAMALKLEPSLAEKIAEEYNKSTDEALVKIKILNTEFIVKSVETKPPHRLMLETCGNAEPLSDLIKAGLKV